MVSSKIVILTINVRK